MGHRNTPRPKLARTAWRLILRATLICGAVLALACMHGWTLAHMHASQESGPPTESSTGENIAQGD